MNYSVLPRSITYDASELVRIKNDSEALEAELCVLRDRADKLLKRRPYSVIYKKLMPPTEDPHDYMTMGPYWWPNPDTADGLPYIRKDGVKNPESSDENTFGAMAGASFCLSILAYVYDNEEYADAAVRYLSAWHLDEQTRMNPHAEYAQAIPGICEGRGIGLIDFAASFQVFEATEILYALGAMTEEVYRGIKAWYVEFVNWMVTSEKGIDEDNYFNNHGTWYDVQVLAAAIFTDRPALARRVAVSTTSKRHMTHIMEDGSQPHELARTMAFGYSLMNLKGLSILTGLRARLGYDMKSDEGVRLIAKAAEFIYPYAVDQKDFPYQQIKPTDGGAEMCRILRFLAEITEDGRYAEMSAAIEKPSYLLGAFPTWQ